jgi:hypothetical protein
MPTATPQDESRSARIDRAALFELLRYSPHAGQQLVHDSKARFRVLSCGVRWGKSTCASMEAVCALLEPRDQSMGWIVAPTYDLTMHILTRVRVAILQYMPHRVLDDDTRSSRLVVQNLGGGTSEVRAKTADNPTSLLGEALDWMIVDEAAKMRAEVWESYLAPRLVDRRGWALLISTPRGLNWFFESWRLGQAGHDPEYESWRGPTLDNPNLKAEVVAGEKSRLTRGAYEQEYEARFEGEELLPCEECGGPSDAVPGLLVTLDYASVPRCGRCGGEVDYEGHTIVARTEKGLRRLFVIDGSAGWRKKRLELDPLVAAEVERRFITEQFTR